MKTILFILVSFIAVTALLSGILLISKPDGSIMNLPLSLLYGTPFKDFRIPGIILAVIVGGTNLLAVFFNLLRHRTRYDWAMAGGAVITGWVIAQFILTGAFHWLLIFYFVLGIFIVLLAYQLKGKWAL